MLVDDTVSYIYISFWDRSFLNKILWCIYKVYRILYVSIWFYFLPFVVIIGSYAVPLIMNKTPLVDPFKATAQVLATTHK